MTRSFALGGIAILLLVAAATTAIIVSATRSALASNREIVEVLHFVGATDRYIAREFERHFLRLGVRAGLVGAVCAIAVFLSMTAVMQVLGGGDVTVAEVHRLIGSGSLDVEGYMLLGGVVVIIAVAVHADLAIRRFPYLEFQALRLCPLPQRKRLPVHACRTGGVTSSTKSDSVLAACTAAGHLRRVRRQRSSHDEKPAASDSVATGMALSLSGLGFVMFATVVTRPPAPGDPHADGIVVLTGESRRIAEGARLLNEGRAERMLISGVFRHTGKRALMKISGLPEQKFDCCVDVGYTAHDTAGNANEARSWASPRHYASLIIVTASYHMPRSLAELSLALPGARLIPHPVMPGQLPRKPLVAQPRGRAAALVRIHQVPADGRAFDGGARRGRRAELARRAATGRPAGI